MQGDPLVSIRCLVYNHEPFLRQCLDGFVMQQTTFPFEAIIHDDASTDGSASIIREYAEKYPDIIKPIFEAENQWGKGTISKIVNAAIHPNSKYIAVCEGDDYWTDPHKLQIQVDFLESHPDYALCSHDYLSYYQDSGEFNDLSFYERAFNKKNMSKSYEYTLKNYFNGWWTKPLTCVYRKYNYIEELLSKGYTSFRDDIFYYNILTHGKGMLLMRVMGVYRIHDGGTWSNLEYRDKREKTIENALQIYQIEGDKRAFIVIRNCMLSILGFHNENGEKGFLIQELKRYRKMAPFDEFLRLLLAIGRSKISNLYHKVFKEAF